MDHNTMLNTFFPYVKYELPNLICARCLFPHFKGYDSVFLTISYLILEGCY